jgi:DNA-directed RNA polymerase specialized sigma24 family protein
LAGFTQREIAKLFRTALGSVNEYVSKGYEEYNNKK